MKLEINEDLSNTQGIQILKSYFLNFQKRFNVIK